MIGAPLQIRHLAKTYPGSEHPVFQDFCLEVEAGSLCALVGVSGVGKTTLLNCIAALDTWEQGEILLDGSPVPRSDPEARSLFRRRHVGMAFQEAHLLPEFTVLENLLMPATIDGSDLRGQEAWAMELLAQVGLSGLDQRHPRELSGGQAARVGLLRALMRKPALWLLDEPTGNLDPATSMEVFQVLQNLHEALKPTTLLVTHNAALAARCERIIQMG